MSKSSESRVADRIVVSFDGDDSTGDSLRKHSYVRYLHRSKAGTVTVGDEWEEFINCGCGTTEDVTLRVETVEGGSKLGDSTTITYRTRSG